MNTLIVRMATAMFVVFSGLGNASGAEKEPGHLEEAVAQHKAMAQAHAEAAKCLEAGRGEKVCHGVGEAA